MPKSSQISYWREVLGVSASKLVNTVGVILLIIVLSSAFSVSEIGLFFFFFVLVEFLSNFVAGIAKAVRKRVSGNPGKCSEYLVVGILFAILFQTLMSALILIVFVYVPNGLLPDTVEMADLDLVLSSIFLLFAQSLGKLMLNYNSGLGNPSRSEWIGRAFPGALFFVATIFVVNMGYGLASIFLVGMLSYLVSATLMYLITRPNLIVIPSLEKFLSIARFAKWSILSRIASNIYTSADVLILGTLVTSLSVGYYQSSNDLAQIVFILPYGIFSVTSVKVSGLHAESERSKIINLMKNSLKLSPAIPVMLLFISIAFGKDIIGLIYGSDFTKAYYYFVGLVLIEVLASYRKPIVGLNEGTDDPQVPFYSNILAIFVNFLSVIPLVIVFGGIGVVISTILSGITRLVSICWFSRDHLKNISLDLDFIYCYTIGTVLLISSIIVKNIYVISIYDKVFLILTFITIYCTSLYYLMDVELN